MVMSLCKANITAPQTQDYVWVKIAKQTCQQAILLNLEVCQQPSVASKQASKQSMQNENEAKYLHPLLKKRKSSFNALHKNLVR